MKIVQTKRDEEEYELLKELMYSKGTPINLFFLRKGLPKEYFLNPQIRLWRLNPVSYTHLTLPTNREV